MFPFLNPPPSSLPIPSLWVVPVHQPQASSIVHRTWTGFVLKSQIPLICTSSKLAARSQGGRCLATVALGAHPVGRTTSLDSLKISIPFESKSSCLSLFLHYYIQIKHFWQGLYVSSGASLLVQMVKNPLARQEM